MNAFISMNPTLHGSNTWGMFNVSSLFDGYKTSLALRSDNYLKKNGSSSFKK